MKKITLVAFLMFLSIMAFAQKPVKFGVYVGGVVPAGNLGEGDEIKKTKEAPLGDISKWAYVDEKKGTQGYADIGFNVGFDVTVNLPVDGLGIVGSVDLFYNNTKSDVGNYLKDVSKYITTHDNNISEVNSTLPYTLNIPILFGVNYIHNFNHIVGVWGEAGVGPNFRLITDYTTETDYLEAITDGANTYDKMTETTKYDSAVTFGFKIGAGAMLWDKMSIGLYYYSLGSAKVTGSVECKHGDKEFKLLDNQFKGEKAMSSSEIAVRVGYHF